MIRVPVLLLVSAVATSVWCQRGSVTILPKDFSFRTSLHVARSLNPEATEDLAVRTKSGDVATIIVKKRDRGRNLKDVWSQNSTNWKPIAPSRSESLRKLESYLARNDTSRSSNATASFSISLLKDAHHRTENFRSTSRENATSDFKAKNNLDRRDNLLKSTATSVPTESNVQKLESSLVFGDVTTSPYPSEKSARSVEPQDALQNSIGQIKNQLSDADFRPRQSQFLEPTFVVSSAVSLDGKGNSEAEGNRQTRKLHVDPDGVPVITGIRVPDDESDRQVWRNARVINGILVPYAKHHNSKYPQKGSQSTGQPPSAQWLNTKQTQKKPMNNIIKYNAPPGKWSNERMSSTNPPPPNIMLIGEQDDRWHEIGMVSNAHKQEAEQDMSKFRPSPMGIRDDVRQSQDEDYVKDKILDYIKQINHPRSRAVRKVEDRDARAILEAGNNYFTPSTKSPSRVSFEGVRTPVLHYAHPEFGVQPAKVVSTTLPPKEPEGEPILDSRAQVLAYFAHDIHADRSPFAFEPGLEEEARVQESLDAKPIKPTRPKKPYMSPKYVDMPYGHHNKYEYASKYPFSYKGYYNRVHEAEKPMWRRISDTVKDHVQSGIEKVTNLTRPVVEPIMKATNKISQNLGLSYGSKDLIKKNVDLAAGSSILIPSLVAGGAALGIGAVALGRYLHMDVTHMRSLNSQAGFLPQNSTPDFYSDGTLDNIPSSLLDEKYEDKQKVAETEKVIPSENLANNAGEIKTEEIRSPDRAGVNHHAPSDFALSNNDRSQER